MSVTRNVREIALSRLENRIVQALVIPKKRIKTKPTRASKERKLKLKKIRSEIKKNRGGGNYINLRSYSYLGSRFIFS